MNEPRHSEETYERSVDLSLWKKLFRYTRPYRWQVLFLGFTAVGVATVDIGFPLLTRRVVDDVSARGADIDLVPYAAMYLGLMTALCLFVFGFISLAGMIRTHVSHDIRRAGFANLQELSFSFYDRRPVGWLMARMTSDCERLSNILAWGILDFIWGVTLMSGIAVVMLWLDLKLALVVLAVIPALAWVSARFQKRILGSARVVRKVNSRITASYNESVMGNRTSKVFVREQENLEEFQSLSSEMFSASVRNALQSAVFLPIVLTLGSLATGLALALGGLDVTGGVISLGTLIAFLTYTRQFFDPIQELAHWFAELQMAQAAAERVLGLIDATPEIRDSKEVTGRIRELRDRRRPEGMAEDGYPSRIREIEFRDVSFSYLDGPPILTDFSLRVESGETIALVGATGGGKTTILGLLCRFYEPTAGEILMDGIDYRERGLHWLQSNLGIVLQEPHLFSGSVAENIRYGDLDATDEMIVEAARLVGADDFIRDLEGGYRSEVGESGHRLSTGQKQLVSFARAILARPQILIMDEATSSVDTETEQRIQKGLERVLAGRTSFVIAHRLSTIRSADRILVIENGRILEEGSHRELLARGARYHELYTRQSLSDPLQYARVWT